MTPSGSHRIVSIACVYANFLGWIFMVVLEVKMHGLFAAIGASGFIVYALFAALTLRFKIWMVVTHLVRIMALIDITLMTTRLLLLHSSLSPFTWAEAAMTLGCSAAMVLLTSQCLTKTRLKE